MKKAGQGARPAGAADQKISEKMPITTSRPMMKMMPMVLPRNFSMGATPVLSVQYWDWSAVGIVQAKSAPAAIAAAG
ncbi:hypothetical protein [Phytopseudomonas daroniae]|uniref:hypothetical protein n=1 Tax=Pseudomonadaceae TaxID=135621 RepID=UPI0010379FBC|nr:MULTISPECIES: hypothetical protein [Pseudomonas]